MSLNRRSSIRKDKTSTSYGASRVTKDEDLAYYVHDRVELMRQVFSILSPKEIKSMAPACVRKLSNDELEEICLDELLGISSKRVCAIIDGAEPPSETSSSESEQTDDRRHEEPIDVVDLDSLSNASVQSSSRGKKKRRRKKRAESSDKEPRGAGSTVLELLELQARARALKAQLNYQNSIKEQSAREASDHDEVEVKEESPVVLEISSDEEKPDLQQLDKVPELPPEKPPPPPRQKKKKKQKSKSPKPTDVNTVNQYNAVLPTKDVSQSESSPNKNKKTKKKKSEKQTKSKDDKQQKEVDNTEPSDKKDDVIKKHDDVNRKDDNIVIIDDDDDEETTLELPPSEVAIDAVNVNSQKETDFTVTIPQVGETTRKIQLDRNNVFISVPNVPSTDIRVVSVVKQIKKINSCVQNVKKPPKLNSTVVVAEKNETKKNKNEGKKTKEVTKEIDHDEIELQLSESEKVDLLEDLDSKNLENIDSSSDSQDGSASSDTDNDRSSKDVNMSNVDKGPNLLTSETTSMNLSITNEDNSDTEQNDLSVDDCNRKHNYEDANLEIVQVTMNYQENATEDTISDEVSTDNRSKTLIIETNKNSQITLEPLKAGSDNVNIKNIWVSSVETRKLPCLDDIPIMNYTVSYEDTSSDEVSNDNISKKLMIETNKHSQITLESLKAGIDNVNIKNICVSSEQTIEVSCLGDIPIVHEEFGPKTYEELSLNVCKAQNNDVDVEKTNTNNLEVNINEETCDSDQSSSESSDDRSEEERNESPQDKEKVDTNTQHVKDRKLLELIEDTIASDITEKETDDKRSKNNSPKKYLSNEESQCEKHLEEGELYDYSDSEVEAFDVQPEIVCISDDDGTEAEKTEKKKSKKQKKGKKCKKDRKTCSDNSDQNFYTQKNAFSDVEKEHAIQNETVQVKTSIENETVNRSSNDSDVFEILDLSDDSSCYEVEGVSVLSKEPTSEEIEALSVKIDQFQRVDVITGEHIENDEKSNDIENIVDAKNISWKDRYLDSKKVKIVLSTSNILNAIRKKNKELKKKMQESKKIEVEDVDDTSSKETENIEEGSIDHFNMLQGSTKYVDPVPEQKTIENKEEQIEETGNVHINLTNEMQKDAKQLLKMYKRLLKYNDLNKQKQKDPNKKKKAKKSKKKKDVSTVSGYTVSDIATVKNM